jgi:hypothetical protein
MISFDLPTQFNGLQFCEELKAVGINIDNREDMYATTDGFLWLKIENKDTQKVQDVLNAHIPKPISEPTIAEKLASVGLSIDDLKAALGL